MKLASVYDFGMTVFDLVDIEDGPGLRSAAKLLTKDESAADRGEYCQPKFLEGCLTRLDGAGPDTPWYIGLGPHELLLSPLTAAKHC